jgi:2-methylcitrate dehydratase PrpD
LDQVPSPVVEKTKQQNLSMLAALYSGVDSDGGQSVLQTVSGRQSQGSCTLLPNGEKTSSCDALFAHAACSMAYDFDDYCFMGHTGHSAILASLTLGEALGSGGKAILEAQVAANEIAGRIGAACLIGPHNGQAWSFIHLAGASAAASKLLGLENQIADALGIAFMQPNYMLFPGFFSCSKLLTASFPAVAGLQAAELAKGGLKGSHDVLERDAFLRQFSFAPLTWALEGLGEAWVTHTMAFKPWPGCVYIDTAIEAMENILHREVRPSQIDRVDVLATKMTDSMERLGKKFTPKVTTERVNFSARYSMATLLEYGALTTRNVARPDKTRLDPWFNRIEVCHECAFTRATAEALKRQNLDPVAGLDLKDGMRIILLAPELAPDFRIEEWVPTFTLPSDPPDIRGVNGLVLPFPSKVIVHLRGAGREEDQVDFHRGAPGSRFDPKEVVRNKFFQQAEPMIGEQRTCDAADLVERMESWPSPEQLWQLLVKT